MCKGIGVVVVVVVVVVGSWVHAWVGSGDVCQVGAVLHASGEGQVGVGLFMHVGWVWWVWWGAPTHGVGMHVMWVRWRVQVVGGAGLLIGSGVCQVVDCRVGQVVDCRVGLVVDSRVGLVGDCKVGQMVDCRVGQYACQ